LIERLMSHRIIRTPKQPQDALRIKPGIVTRIAISILRRISRVQTTTVYCENQVVHRWLAVAMLVTWPCLFVTQLLDFRFGTRLQPTPLWSFQKIELLLAELDRVTTGSTKRTHATTHRNPLLTAKILLPATPPMPRHRVATLRRCALVCDGWRSAQPPWRLNSVLYP